MVKERATLFIQVPNLTKHADHDID